jgi:uncharacterized tellurite resistance protein B-like protein
VIAALSKADQLLLLEFLCAIAWVDSEVTPAERRYISRLMDHLELSQEERARVQEWLENEPAPNSVKPERIPREHRHVFINALREVMYADGEVNAWERERFEQLRAALS